MMDKVFTYHCATVLYKMWLAGFSYNKTN